MIQQLTRNYRTAPVTTDKERSLYGTYTPKTLRKSRPEQTNTQHSIQKIQITEEPRTQPPVLQPLITRRPYIYDQNGKIAPALQMKPKKRAWSWKVFIVGGSIGIILLYTLFFLVITALLTLSNLYAYGSTHTSYASTTLNGEPSTIVSNNVNHTIYITILHKGIGTTYTLPQLKNASWGDLDSVVPTASINSQGQITITLLGAISYTHPFFTRPEATFIMSPNNTSPSNTGYTIIQQQ